MRSKRQAFAQLVPSRRDERDFMGLGDASRHQRGLRADKEITDEAILAAAFASDGAKGTGLDERTIVRSRYIVAAAPLDAEDYKLHDALASANDFIVL